jgi:hypothetical protein
MKIINNLLLGVAALATGSVTTYTAYADDLVTLRTTAAFTGITQGAAPNGRLVYDNANFAGHNLVNLAMGRDLNDTNYPQQVLAITFDCDLSSASLVVYDESISNIVGGVASSSVLDVVKQQTTKKQPGPDRAQFVAMMNVFQTGNAINGLQGGYITVAGRLSLNPTNSCPQPALVLEKDPTDKVDAELPAEADPDNGPAYHTGLAHLVGDVMTVTSGQTQTVLLPYGQLSIRRELPIAAPVETD